MSKYPVKDGLDEMSKGQDLVWKDGLIHLSKIHLNEVLVHSEKISELSGPEHPERGWSWTREW